MATEQLEDIYGLLAQQLVDSEAVAYAAFATKNESVRNTPSATLRWSEFDIERDVAGAMDLKGELTVDIAGTTLNQISAALWGVLDCFFDADRRTALAALGLILIEPVTLQFPSLLDGGGSRLNSSVVFEIRIRRFYTDGG